MCTKKRTERIDRTACMSDNRIQVVGLHCWQNAFTAAFHPAETTEHFNPRSLLKSFDMSWEKWEDFPEHLQRQSTSKNKITDRFRPCKLVRFPAVTVLTFKSVWVDVWSYGRLISYDPVTVVDLRYCKMHVVCRVCGSQSRVAEGTSATVWVSGSRPFHGSCCLHLDEQYQRCTVRVPNIFGPTFWNLLHVTFWQL
jgi:hypothetical protein